MIYRNDDPRAMIALEEERTGNYGDYYNDRDMKYCPCCGAYEPDHFFMNDDEECIGCYECVHVVYDLF